MYETKFDIMQGGEDGIEIFKKLLKPALVLAFITFLLAGSRLIIDPAYLRLLNGQFHEVDQGMRLISNILTIVMTPIGSIIGIMILYYHKDAITEETALSVKLLSSFKVVVKVFLVTMGIFIPLVLVLGIFIGLSVIVDSFILTMILVVVLVLVAIIISPMFIFVYQGMVFDDMGAFQSIKHSFKLVKHNYFRLLLLMILLGGAAAVLTATFRFHIVGIIFSMMVTAVTSKLVMCIYSSVYLQARPEPEIEITE